MRSSVSLEGGSIPLPEIRGCFVGGLAKVEEYGFGIGCAAHLVVADIEAAQRFVVVGRGRGDGRGAEAGTKNLDRPLARFLEEPPSESSHLKTSPHGVEVLTSL